MKIKRKVKRNPDGSFVKRKTIPLTGVYDDPKNVKYIDAWTSGNSVKLSYRDRNGKLKINTIENYGDEGWYFTISKKDYLSLGERRISDLEDNCLNFIDNPVRFEVAGEWCKVFVSNKNINERYTSRSDDRVKLKRLFEKIGIKVYEADLKLHKRYCLDNDIETADNYKVLYYDIEIDDRNAGIVVGRDKILTIAAVNQDGEVFFFHDENDDEVKLLSEFMKFVNYNYDILVGYNSNSFDRPYIEKRLVENFLEKDMSYFKYRVAHIDIMEVFIKRFAGDSEITSWSLEFISQYFLGHGKTVGGPTFGNGEGYKYYKERFEDFKKYNIGDAMNLYELNKVLSIIDQIILECQICHAFPSKFSISEILDSFILNSVKGKGIHFNSIVYAQNQIRCPSCNHTNDSEIPVDEIIGLFKCVRCGESFDPNNENEIVGAHVFEPVSGLHDNVFVLDYKALYPSIIRTWNIGPDTFVEPTEHDSIEMFDVSDHLIKSANNHYFEHPESKMSTIKSAVEKLLQLRSIYKKEMNSHKEGTEEYKVFKAKQNAVKMLANSIYGLMGYQFGRFYRKEIAEAITLGGQWLNKQTKKWFEERGYSVIYGDTDSVFIRGDENFRGKIDDLLKELHEFYDQSLKREFNIDESFIELEYEKHFKRILMIKKKHYSGNIVELDGETFDKNGEPLNKLVIKGLECIKRDTIPIAKTLQKELLNSLIFKNKTAGEYALWIENLMSDFLAHKFKVEELVIRKKLTKNPNSYKKIPTHAVIANEMLEREMECYVGMQIPYLVLNHSPIVAVHPDWYEGGVNLEYYWDQQVYGILKRVLEVAFPNYNWNQFTIKNRNKKKDRIVQFKKWFNDPKKQTPKQKSNLLKKLADCSILNSDEKNLIKKEFGMKVMRVKKVKLKSNRG